MNIKPGMLITAYHKGFHTVLSVTPEKKHTNDPAWSHYPKELRRTPPQVEYRITFDSNGKPIKGKGRVYSCAIDFCKPVTPTLIREMVAGYQTIINALNAIPLPAINTTDDTVQSDMADRARRRPANYNSLSGEEQWGIDKDLGILDWDGK